MAVEVAALGVRPQQIIKNLSGYFEILPYSAIVEFDLENLLLRIITYLCDCGRFYCHGVLQ